MSGAPEIREWWSAAEFADLGLPGVPADEKAVRAMIERAGGNDPTRAYGPSNLLGIWRRREERGGGREYRMDVLPTDARAALAQRLNRAAAPKKEPRVKKRENEAVAARWDWFERLPDARKKKAQERLTALRSVEDLMVSGRSRDRAMMDISVQVGVSLRTLYGWAEMVAGIDRVNWLPYLMPRHAGRTSTAEYSEEAWDYFRDSYLTQSGRSAAYVYRDLIEIAKVQGWTVPSCKTLERRLGKIDTARKIYLRQGEEALKRLFPSQERDKTALHALEAVNADGHKVDVFVRWLNGTVCRPILIGFQDIYSGKILSWRVDLAETWDAVRLAFCDMVETYGVPEHVLLDNGRAFASKKLTGGTPNRFRFKVKPEEPEGVITALNCRIHWATPYHGQSKPIERAWRDLAHAIGRDVRCEGAFTGNNIAAKPENYGSRAVPYEVFLQVVSDRILEHNARLGRRSKVCGGRLSFDQAFAASYEAALITKPTEAALRKLLLSSELVTASKDNGSIELAGNRYWAEFMIEERGRKVTLRFDPDALQQPVHVYTPAGAYLGAAPCIEAVGFFSTEAARAHARVRNDFLKATKAVALAEQKLTLAEQVALLPQVETPQPPESKIVRPFIVKGNTALKPANEIEADGSEDPFWSAFNRSAARLQIVRNDDGADD